MAISETQFLELYDVNVAKIYRYIYFRLNSETTAQDLTSEVFLKCWQNLSKDGGKEVKNHRAFIYQITRNLIVDFYRQKDKLPISLEEIADSGNKIADKLPIADRNNDLQEIASKTLDVERIKKALGGLNSDYQEIIIWRYLDELEIAEIAEIMEKKEGAVRTLLSRALADLREVLRQ